MMWSLLARGSLVFLVTMTGIHGQYYDSTTDTEAASFIDSMEQLGAFKDCGKFSRIDAYMLAKTLGEIDRNTISAAGLGEHLEEAEEVRDRFYPTMDTINFKTYLLPFRIREENSTVAGWRKTLRAQVDPLIKDIVTPQEAAPKILAWCRSKVKDSDGEECYPLGLKGDLDPLTTLALGEGTDCDLSILAVAALRSAGVVSRLVFAPSIAGEAGGKIWVEYRAEDTWIPWVASAPVGMDARKYLLGRFGGRLALILANPDKPINITSSYIPVAHISVSFSNVADQQRVGWNLLLQGSDQLRPITGRNIYLHLSDSIDVGPGNYIMVAGDRNHMAALKPFAATAGQSVAYAFDMSKKGVQTLDIADPSNTASQGPIAFAAMSPDEVLNPDLW